MTEDGQPLFSTAHPKGQCMTLDAATTKFEAEFTSVIDFDPNQEKATCAPRSNNQYFVVCSGGPKREGLQTTMYCTEQEAVDEWLIAAQSQHKRLPGRILYWRSRPQIETIGKKRKQYHVYSRMTFG